jgi:hypothetical protein
MSIDHLRGRQPLLEHFLDEDLIIMHPLAVEVWALSTFICSHLRG